MPDSGCNRTYDLVSFTSPHCHSWRPRKCPQQAQKRRRTEAASPTYPLAMAGGDPDGRGAMDPWFPAPMLPGTIFLPLRAAASSIALPPRAVLLTCSIAAAAAPCRCLARAGCGTCEPRRTRVVAPGRVRNRRDRSNQAASRDGKYFPTHS